MNTLKGVLLCQHPDRQQMTQSIRLVAGVSVPTFLYGTAWKEEATTELVSQALAAGFRGFDTANQRRHYDEEGVGRALAGVITKGVRREELFVQTKFTHRAGQDHRLPYDEQADVAEQVRQSFRSSLEHLGIGRIDSYLLHGPSHRIGLGPADREAWRAMEALHDAGSALLLGVSNVSSDQLEELIRFARVPPVFVQNRCYAQLGWDARVREICDRHSIIYQAFSLLTANAVVLQQPAIRKIAARHERTIPQVIFRFSQALGMIPLTGTRDPSHMTQDLEIHDFELNDEDVRAISVCGI
jgi:diketogulonate reductase-like aldo/keto reductase